MKYIVHWPTGPVVCCEKHANQLKNLSSILGTHIAVVLSSTDEECTNCINEKKEKQSETKD